MSQKVIDIVKGISVAAGNAYDGAKDENGEDLKIGLKREEGNPNLRIDPYMGTYYYRANVNVEPLNNAKVRKALTYSIDREKLTEKVTQCGQIPAYSFTPPGAAGYNPDTEIPYTQN